MELNKVKTCELFEELKKRQGVEVLAEQNPDGFMEYRLGESNGNSRYVAPKRVVEGPQTILRILD